MIIPQRYIAVVDDEAPVRTMLGRVLRLANYEAVAFGSGEELLTSLGSRTPDCIVLDIHMPGLSGLDVQARLRATCVDVPAIFITASDDSALEHAVRDADGVALLRKPFSSEALLQAVDAALRIKHGPS